ncbi:MAG TPA: hypothetical protein EYP14_18830 [Planctomycetaceae bacterium]|nr:hypothetical protein [Planctomycetaceae bacterium]
MIRLVAFVTSILCFVIVLGEALGLGLLWMRGQLTPETVQEIRVILSGETQEIAIEEQENDREFPSTDQVIAERALRILDLESRERELDQLKTLVDESRELVLKEHELLTAKKQAFEQRLAQIQSQLKSQATELARAVIAQSSTKDAVRQLMALDVDQNVILIQGLTEKKIAELLKEFGRGDAEQVERGLRIFEALSRGEPTRAVVEKAIQKMGGDARPPES